MAINVVSSTIILLIPHSILKPLRKHARRGGSPLPAQHYSPWTRTPRAQIGPTTILKQSSTNNSTKNSTNKSTNNNTNNIMNNHSMNHITLVNKGLGGAAA